MTGCLWFVVGPSGAGKDTVLACLAAGLIPQDGVLIARRIITRPCLPGGTEQHLSVTDDDFARLDQAGAFALRWFCHDVHYGIGVEVQTWLAAGSQVIVNGSRGALPLARRVFGSALRVVEITAPPDLLAVRLAARGREGVTEIAARLARTDTLLPTGADLIIVNDTTPEAATARLRAALSVEDLSCS